MTDLALPTLDATVRSLVTSQLNRFGAATDGWIQRDSSAFLADRYQEIDQNNVPLGGFEYLPGASGGGSADFNHGEAVVSGAWVARDRTTTVSLPTGDTTTIYVGYDVSETNTVILGKVGSFVPADPRIPLWELTTDGNDTITDQTDLRRTSYEIDAIASQYDSTASGVVDDAEDAQKLGGEPPGGWMRADTSDEFEAVPAFAAQSTPQRAPGTGSGEVWRAGGPNADSALGVQGGFGRVAWTWNCYYDNGSNDWRYESGNEPASMILMNGDTIILRTAAGGNIDGVISFDRATVTDGTIDVAESANSVDGSDVSGNVSSSAALDSVPAKKVLGTNQISLSGDELETDMYVEIPVDSDERLDLLFYSSNGASGHTYELRNPDGSVLQDVYGVQDSEFSNPIASSTDSGNFTLIADPGGDNYYGGFAINTKITVYTT